MSRCQTELTAQDSTTSSRSVPIQSNSASLQTAVDMQADCLLPLELQRRALALHYLNQTRIHSRQAAIYFRTARYFLVRWLGTKLVRLWCRVSTPAGTANG